MDEKNFLIEKFIQNKLNEKEQLSFDRLLEEDAGFKKEVDFQKKLQKIVTQTQEEETNGQAEFRRLVHDLEQKGIHKKPRRIRTFWLAAAGLALLFALSFFFELFADKSPQDLYAEYFTPYRNVISPVERNNSHTDEKAVAFMLYETGKYEKASEKFIELYKLNGESHYLFYNAIALMQLNKQDQAIAQLEKYLKTGGILSDKALWYLALAQLHEARIPEAQSTLEKIQANGTYKAQEAREILRQLDD